MADGRPETSVKRLECTARTVHFGFYDAALAPVLEVDSGDEILVETVSADPGDAVPPAWLPPRIREIHERAERGTGPHILTGPIAVRGAKAGDVLAVDILEIRLTQPYGYNIVSPMKGMFPGEQSAQRTTIIPIDLATGMAEVAPGVSIQTRPFFGQLGVAPPAAWGRLDSRPPNRHGGNIDNKELLPGTRLMLPIAVDGALFSVGDGHAAQGDGEVNQTAIECPMKRADLTLDIVPDLFGRPLTIPVADTPAGWVAMGLGDDLDEAAAEALDAMLDLLGALHGLGRSDAMALASVVVDLRVTQVANQVFGVHAVLPRDAVR